MAEASLNTIHFMQLSNELEAKYAESLRRHSFAIDRTIMTISTFCIEILQDFICNIVQLYISS